jgi:DNA (cytosine-5)-methyltransferase 1
MLACCTFPCTNTSCASDRTGLFGLKSGVVYRYIELLQQKGGADSYPFTLLENPTGLIARNNSQDLRYLVQRLNMMGYVATIVSVDAMHFVPQSRPRIFIVATHKSIAERCWTPLSHTDKIPSNTDLYPPPLRKWFSDNLDLKLAIANLPELPTRTLQLHDCLYIADNQYNLSDLQSNNLIENMAPKHLALFQKLVSSNGLHIATISRRTRTHNDRKFNATELSTSGLAPAQRPKRGLLSNIPSNRK